MVKERENGSGQPAAALVGEDIVDMAFADALLVRLPEGGVEQVGMVAHEDFAHGRVAQQKGREGFREHIARAHGVPDLAAELVLLRSEERRVGKECRSRWSPYH